MPPKPNEFDSATLISRLRALVRHEIDRRLHRRIVEIDRRRRDVVANRQDAEDRLDRAGRAEQMADRRFGRRHRHLRGGIAEQPLDRAEFDLVAERRRGAVRVDVVDIGRRDAGALHRGAHAAEGAIAVRRRRGDVIGVAGQAVADHFGVDLRAALLGVLVFLEHHDAGALAHHEAVAILVVGTRRLFGRVVETGRQRARRRRSRPSTAGRSAIPCRPPPSRRRRRARSARLHRRSHARRSSRRSPRHGWAP